MKISFFKKVISPEVGVRLSGYRMEDFSLSKLDDLFMTGLLVDDGERKVLLISLDLLCLNEAFIRKVRAKCGEILGVPEYHVMLTTTHTHGGPQVNTEPLFDDHVEWAYLDDLEQAILEECRKLPERLVEANAFSYSMKMDENKNRRVVMADNYACYLPHRAELRRIADGFVDQELGNLFFVAKGQDFPTYVVGNYAAHPLAGHSVGTGGRRISADFPTYFREYVKQECGAECMYVSGAIGDMIPKEDELGADAAKQLGTRLAKGILRGMLDATRNPERFKMQSQKVGAFSRKISVPFRPSYRNNPEMLPSHYLDKDTVDLELQCIAIGDVCFVGVPGEFCAELGAEIKWHSPFRKAYIAFGATAYHEYFCPANFLLQGGYEAERHHFSPRYSLELVKTAVDAMRELHDSLYPLGDTEEDFQTLRNQVTIKSTKMTP